MGSNTKSGQPRLLQVNERSWHEPYARGHDRVYRESRGGGGLQELRGAPPLPGGCESREPRFARRTKAVAAVYSTRRRRSNAVRHELATPFEMIPPAVATLCTRKLVNGCCVHVIGWPNKPLQPTARRCRASRAADFVRCALGMWRHADG
jgi:hypothetical protein